MTPPSAQTLDHPIPEQTLRRVPLYHQILAEMLVAGDAYVSSRHLAGFFGIDDTQVRKDVSLIGYKGKPKAGYSVSGLKLDPTYTPAKKYRSIAETTLKAQEEARRAGTGQ